MPAGRLAVLLLLLTALILPESQRQRPARLALLVDASEHRSAAAAEGLQTRVTRQLRDLDDQLEIVPATPDGQTALEVGLQRALWRLDPAAGNSIVIASTGRWDPAIESLLQQINNAGVPLYWLPVDTADSPRILQLAAAGRARPGDILPVIVSTASLPAGDFQLVLHANGEAIARATPQANGRNVFSVVVPASGPLRLDAELLNTRSGATVDHLFDAAVVNVASTPHLLLLSDGPSPLADALAAGGWPLRRVATQEFAATVHSLERFSAIIIDNVPATSLPEAEWMAVAHAVQRNGLGLLVLGGPQAFGLGAYRGSTLETLLPVVSEPPQREQPAGVVFLIDVSGSMGRGASERLRTSRAAVLHTAEALRSVDRVGLIGFDVEARQLLPTESRDDHARALRDAWPERASGGTRVVPALQAGLSALAAAGVEQKLLILVSDGMLAATDIVALEAALAHSDVEFIAMLLSQDEGKQQPLARIATDGNVTLLRVDDVLRLPVLMRQQVEARRPALVQEATQPVPNPAAGFRGLPAAWPAVDGYLVTRARPGVDVFLKSGDGEPLLAAWTAGAGRVLAATPGLGSLAGNWLTWEQWPALAAALVEHVIVREPAQVRIEREGQAGAPALTFDTGNTAAPRRVLVAESGAAPVEVVAIPSAPGLYRIPLEHTQRGALTVIWESADGIFRQAVAAAPLRHNAATAEPVARRFAAAGLLEEWPDNSTLPQSLRDAQLPMSIQRSLIATALLLFIMLLAAERTSGFRVSAVERIS